jgi:hypothetical protein
VRCAASSLHGRGSAGQQIGEKMMKTEKLETVAMVKHTGHSCIGCMGSESPFIVFGLPDNSELLWHSDNVESIAKRFGFPRMQDMEGRYVGIVANIRPSKRTAGRWQVQRMVNLEDR